MPAASRTASASAVTGALAASITIGARTAAALPWWITPPSAAGMRTSHSAASNSSFVIRSASA